MTRKTRNRTKLLQLLLTMGLAAALTCAACKSSDPTEGNRQKKTFKRVHPVEVYGDPQIFDGPRLQLVWRPAEEKRETVWSMKLDGSDLRRTVEPELYFKIGAYPTGWPKRSPDDRYLATTFVSKDIVTTYAVLFDLKEKTSLIMAESSIAHEFQWTHDSKQVWFYIREGPVQYDVDDKKLSMRPMVYSQGYYLLPDKERLLAVRDYGFDIRKLNGELIRKVELTDDPRLKPITEYHALSLDGRRLFYKIGLNAYVIETEKPGEKLFEKRDLCSGVIFSMNSDEIICRRDGIFFYNLITGEKRFMKQAGGGTGSGYQLINLRGRGK